MTLYNEKLPKPDFTNMHKHYLSRIDEKLNAFWLFLKKSTDPGFTKLPLYGPLFALPLRMLNTSAAIDHLRKLCLLLRGTIWIPSTVEKNYWYLLIQKFLCTFDFTRIYLGNLNLLQRLFG